MNNKVILILPDGTEIEVDEYGFRKAIESLNIEGFVRKKKKNDHGYHALVSGGKELAVSCDQGRGEKFMLVGNCVQTSLREYEDNNGLVSREVLERWFRIRSFQ